MSQAKHVSYQARGSAPLNAALDPLLNFPPEQKGTCCLCPGLHTPSCHSLLSAPPTDMSNALPGNRQAKGLPDCREASYHHAQILICTILRCLTDVFTDGESSSLAVFIAKVHLCQAYTSQIESCLNTCCSTQQIHHTSLHLAHFWVAKSEAHAEHL